jgi:hypothetical protein
MGGNAELQEAFKNGELYERLDAAGIEYKKIEFDRRYGNLAAMEEDE